MLVELLPGGFRLVGIEPARPKLYCHVAYDSLTPVSSLSGRKLPAPSVSGCRAKPTAEAASQWRAYPRRAGVGNAFVNPGA
jgi:hypothetical protein